MERTDALRRRARWGLTIFYGVAGLLHLLVPKPFIGITPSWVPEPAEVIVLTGLCELLGAVALPVPGARKYAGIGLAFYAVCVYPANIKHAIDSLGAASVSPWQWIYHTVRLPLQLVLVWLPLFAGRIVTWPIPEGRLPPGN